jgi:RHS repeat-associated protein
MEEVVSNKTRTLAALLVFCFGSTLMANVLPVAAFVATLQTSFGDKMISLDASSSSDSDGTITTYTWNFGDGTTGTGKLINKTYSSFGTYNVTLTVKDNLNATKSLVKSVVVQDYGGPVIYIDNQFHRSNIYVKTLPVNVEWWVNVSEPLQNFYWQGEWFPFFSFPWTFNRTYTTEGMQTIQLKAIDVSGNESTLNYPFWIILDNVAPTIEVLPHPSITKNSSIPLSFIIDDDGYVETVVSVNGSPLYYHVQKSITNTYNLPVVGNNVFEVVSTDSAGNVSATKTFTIVRDNVLPVLSSLVPSNSANIDRVAFDVSGVSSKPLAEVYLNDTRLTLSANKLSFSGPFTTQTMGTHNLVWKAVDLAGNQVIVNSTITVAPRILIPELISIKPDRTSRFLIVVGAIGATRPGVEITAKEGIFSFNRGSVIADNYGAFRIKLDPFSSVSITAVDSVVAQTDTITKTYTRATTLSGVVKDDDNNPLPGVTVYVGGVSVATTNGSGVFLINTPKTGEQQVVFDGSTISTSITGPNKKFFKTSVVFNIGLGQSNVLARPIYLVPLVSDGTETVVVAGGGATVTSTHAPGVTLSLPSGVATFPGGLSSGKINLKTIVSDRSTIEVPKGAVPTTVLAMEPSGLSFSERIELTLPNDNELPAGVEFVLLSMNSAKGTWEVDGMAKVTEDGQSVRTKPGQGISHFSLVYAVPLAPQIFNVGNKNVAGINVSEGSFSSSISLPSYKLGSQDVAHKLTYKSAWANPTAVVTNMIHIPEMRTVVKQDVNGTYDGRLAYEWESCFLGVCSTDSGSVMAKIERTDHLKTESWYEPESIKSQLFVGGIASNNVNFGQDPDDEYVHEIYHMPGSVPQQSAYTPILEHEGIPNQSMITYALPLKKPNGEYLETGVYPAVARYQIKLKNITIISGYSDFKATTEEYGVVQSASDPGFYATSSILAQVFPRDQKSNILLQNKVRSPYGRGWHLNANQTILNPDSQSVVIEEADGRLSTYMLDNTVTTVFNGFERDTSLSYGAAGLKQWPYAFVSKFDRIFSETSIAKIDMRNEENPSARKSLEHVGDILTGRGFAANLGWHACSAPYTSGTFMTTKTEYKMRGVFPVLVQKPDGGFIGISHTESSLFEYDAGVVTKLAGKTYNQFYPNVNQPESVIANSIFNTTLWEAWAAVPVTSYPCTTATGPNKNTLIYSTGNQGSGSDYFVEGSGNIGVNPDYLGLGAPKDLIIANSGSMIVADYGNNAIKSFNKTTLEAKVLLHVNRPKGLAEDSNGNIFFSNSEGYISILRQDGTSSIVAGLPLSEGGVNAAEAPAMAMAFDEPYGLAFDASHNYLYVADSGNHRIVKIDFNSGIASNVAGNGTCDPFPSTNTSTALLDSLCSPTLISLDPTNNLIIVDSGHDKLKRVAFSFDQNSTITYLPTNGDKSKLSKNSLGIWTREYRNGTKDIFGADGKQTKNISRIGREVNFTYDSSKRLIQLVDSLGQVSQFNYSGDKISSIVDPALRSTNFSYSGNLLTQVTYPDGTATSYEYDANGLMTKEYNKRSIPTTYVYNQYNRIEKIFSVDGTHRQINDFESGTLANSFTGGIVGPLKSSGLGVNQISDNVVDQNGNTISFERSFNGFISQIKDPKGRVTTVERDLKGKPTKVINPDGTAINYTYDSVTSDLVSFHDLTSGGTEYRTYDAYGNVTSETNALGKSLIRTYNLFGQLVSIQSPEGMVTTYTYNPLGLVQTRSQGNGSSGLTWAYEYNSKGLLTKVTSPDGKFTEFESDLAGNVTKVTAFTTVGVSAITQNQYDLSGRLKKVINPKGDITNYEYLLTGEISKISNALGKELNFNYNTLNQLISKVDENGAEFKFSYDNNGNLLSEIDPNGKSKSFIYDEMNLNVTTILSDDRIDLEYNFRGDLLQLKNNVSQIDYEYDSRRNITSTLLSGIGGMSSYPAVEISNVFDLGGNRTALQSAYGNVAYTYDDDSRVTEVQNSWGDTFGYTFDNFKRLSQISRPGSLTNYVYSPGGLISAINHSAGGVLKSFVEYDRDLRNFPTVKRNPAGTTALAYDGNGQLLTFTGPGSAAEAFTYDAIGNRTTDSSGSKLFDFNSKKLIEDSGYRYYYDNNGNLQQKVPKNTTLKSFNYSYSSKNQLIRFEEFAPPYSTLVKQVDYSYDVLGRLMQKVVWDAAAPSDPKKTYTRKYVYDGRNILFEFDASNNLLVKYTHGSVGPDDVLSLAVTSEGVTAGVANSVGTAYYLKDELNSVTDLINGSGAIVQTYHYSAFGSIGKITNASGTDITSNPLVATFFTFTGREWDRDAKLYHYRARVYDPSLGRFLQVDPHPGRISDPSSVVNSYSYVKNSPSIFTDSSGRDILSDLGRAWDDVVKSDAFRAVVAISIIVAVVVMSPAAAAAGAMSIAMGAFKNGYQSWMNGNQSLEAFSNGVNDYFMYYDKPMTDFAIGALIGEFGTDALKGMQDTKVGANIVGLSAMVYIFASAESWVSMLDNPSEDDKNISWIIGMTATISPIMVGW